MDVECFRDGEYLIYYLRSPDINRAREVSRASKHPLDEYHRAVMNEITDRGTQLECVLDITGIESYGAT